MTLPRPKPQDRRPASDASKSSRPKCVIVSLQTVTKYRRLDAGYYTAQLIDETIADEARAAKAVRDAKRRVLAARKRRGEEQARIAGMRDRGEIVPFPST